MKVANITAMAMNQGFTDGLPSAEEGVDADETITALYFALGMSAALDGDGFRNPRLTMKMTPTAIMTNVTPTLIGE